MWLLALGGMVALRLFLWWSDNLPFFADEAIVALMARHIRQGARPLFFYGQAYMGALDAYLAALAFSLMGERVAAIRLVQGLLYALAAGFSWAWLRRRHPQPDRLATLALWLLPPLGFLLYTSFSLGGYGEALAAGAFLLWWTDVLQAPAVRASQARLFGAAWLWGLVAGLGLWANPLTGVYLLALLPWLWRPFTPRERGLLLLAAGLGGLMGLSPYGLYVYRHGPAQALADLTGGRVPLHPALRNWGTRLLVIGLSWFTVVPGIRPPWDWTFPGGPWAWLPLVLLPLLWRQAGRPGAWARPLLALAGWNLLLWLATPFAGDPSGRYALPSMHAWLLLLAGWLAQVPSPKRRWGLLLGLTGHALGMLLLTTWGPDRYLTPQFNPVSRIDVRPIPELARFLEANNLRFGYTNYWIAYPLAFQSQERLRFAPRLPYHPDLKYTPLDDRIPAYTCQVMQAEDIAYVTAGPPTLETRLRAALQARGITWQEAQVAVYTVFYDLSRPLHPWDLDLTPPPSPADC